METVTRLKGSSQGACCRGDGVNRAPGPATDGQLELLQNLGQVDTIVPTVLKTKLCDLKLFYVFPYVPTHPYKKLQWVIWFNTYLYRITSFFMEMKNILESVEFFPDCTYT